MIHLDTRRADVSQLGPEHGLHLEQEFSRYTEHIGQLLSRLYASKEQDGAWTKWLKLGHDEALVQEIQAYAQKVHGQFDDLVVLGIGGSSLGGYALLKALRHPYWNDLSTEKREGHPRFHFVENVDSDQIAGLLDILDLRRTLILVISKSGTTAETMSAFMLMKQKLNETVGSQQARQQIVAITDKEAGILRPLAEREGYQSFVVPDDVGGRFSVFSAVGLLPAALCGIDITALQKGIQDLDRRLQEPDIRQNPAAQNALIQFLFYQKGKPISVFMPYSNALSPVSDWYVQLWAESLGKKVDLDGKTVHVGPTPVRAVGVTDQHSQVQLFKEGPHDKVITFVEVQKPHQSVTIPAVFDGLESLDYLTGKTFEDLMGAEFEATRASLTRSGRPNVTITLPQVDAYHVAQLLYLLEVQTALTGWLLHIDPFDQPGVEWAKKATKALMGEPSLLDLADEIRLGSSGQPIGT